MSVGLDTNILVYAEGLNDPERRAGAAEVIARFPDSPGVVYITQRTSANMA